MKSILAAALIALSTPVSAAGFVPPQMLSPNTPQQSSGFSLFGIELGMTLTQQTMPNCVDGPMVDHGFMKSRSVVPAPGYDYCLAVDQMLGRMGNQITASPQFRRSLPLGFYSPDVKIEKKTMKITEIDAWTGGVEDQELVLATLTEKFGKPTNLTPMQLQTGLGASFNVINAEWDILGGGHLEFTGATSSPRRGLVTATSAETYQARKASQMQARANQQPL